MNEYACFLTEEDWEIRAGRELRIHGDRKDAWILNDLARARYGKRKKHNSARLTLNSMRAGDATDAAVFKAAFFRANLQSAIAGYEPQREER